MRAPWVTAQQTSQGQPCTFDRAVNFQRLDTVVAACGIVSAYAVSTAQKPQPRRYAELIEADEQDEDFGHDVAKAKSQNTIFKFQKSGNP